MACVECTKGSIHEGTPVGKVETLHGLDTYVTGKRENYRGIIVMVPDVFGLPLNNNQLIADAYANSGDWLVYLPDFFEGDSFPVSYINLLIPAGDSPGILGQLTGWSSGIVKFLKWRGNNTHAIREPVIMNYLKAVKEATTTKVGVAGFCWGGKYALLAGTTKHSLPTGKSLVDAIVIMHPTNVELPGDVDTINVPTSYGLGDKDMVVKVDMKDKVEEINAKRSNSRTTEFIIHSPGKHGFAVRADPKDETQAKILHASITQATNWFDRFL